MTAPTDDPRGPTDKQIGRKLAALREVMGFDVDTVRVGYIGEDVALQKERRAAELTAAHANTPSKVHLDTLGRPFLAVAHNKDALGADEFYATRSVLDIQGHVLEVLDARGNSAERRVYGMLGQSLKVISVDAGDRWHLTNALGQPWSRLPCPRRRGVATIHAFDFEGHLLLEQRQLVADQKTQPDWSALLGHATVDAMAVAAAPLLRRVEWSASLVMAS